MDKRALHDFTLSTRHILTEETSDVLASIYGLKSDGTFESIRMLPNIQQDSNAMKTRNLLERFINDEMMAGLAPVEAYSKLVKETVFTWMNRFIAITMMERRGLIDQTLSRWMESNGFLLWVTESKDDDLLKLYERGDFPKNHFGEGPREQAYRLFILSQCSRIAEEINALFDADSLPSHLFPRPRVLFELTKKINEPIIEEAWKEGNEETIGWVYQYFNEEEKNEVFDRLYRKKDKIRPQDIAAATQLFTPRWIVKYLIHNTLGRTWIQIHPDTKLRKYFDYLIPSQEKPVAQMRLAKDICLLDPACGTMHFGLVAFDLYVKMYEEELENVGKEGWPKNPSINSREDIPASILANNLHGIDIDLRAVQLSAFALYIKAKSYNAKVHLTSINLACADILPLNGNHLENFISSTSLNDTEKRILKSLLPLLRNANQIGSLLRFEEEMNRAIIDEKNRFEAKGRQMDIYGQSAPGFEKSAFEVKFWGDISKSINRSLVRFADEQSAKGRNESYFVGEVFKGMRLLEFLQKRYDIVVTNPPYMTKKNVNAVMTKYLDSAFPESKFDLYSAFIERCNELLVKGGRLGMITQQSFMYTPSYEKMRSRLLVENSIESLCHLGARAFEDISGEKVSTAAYIIQHEQRDDLSTFIRLVDEPDADLKFNTFISALENPEWAITNDILFRCNQTEFEKIPGSPWAYNMPAALKTAFQTMQCLGDIAPPKQGLATADNFRFIRCWWEVYRTPLCAQKLSNGLVNGQKKWIPLMKGGGFQKWYGNQDAVVNWANDGEEIKNYKDNNGKLASRPQNIQFYLMEGLTYSAIGSRGLSTRYMPKGYIFDHGGNCLFPKSHQELLKLLGILNSNIASEILQLLNPTINYYVEDLSRIPIPNCDGFELERLVEEAIFNAKVLASIEETSPDFKAPPPGETIEQMVSWQDGLLKDLKTIERRIDIILSGLYGINTENFVSDDTELAESNKLSRKDVAHMWISYAIGISLGRFELEVSDSTEGTSRLGTNEQSGDCNQFDDIFSHDGILALDKESPKNAGHCIIDILRKLLPEACVEEIVGEIDSGSESPEEKIRQYIMTYFIKLHSQTYNKRPVYELIQSPKGQYGVLVYYHCLTKDTLFLLRSSRFVGGRITFLEERLKEARSTLGSAEGKNKKKIEKKIEGLEASINDLKDLDKNINSVIQMTDENGVVVGWRPEFDDGVLINLAPLCDIIPSMRGTLIDIWEELESGKYDWSHTAMNYWPNRVKEKCTMDPSYAIAHNQTLPREEQIWEK